MEEVAVDNASGDHDQSSGDNDMVQYVIYSGEGDQPIGLEELRDALTKLTGQPVALQDRKESDDEMGSVAQPALSQDTDLNFRLSAERMVGEVSFVDENIVSNGKRSVRRKAPDSSLSNKLVIDDSNVSDLLKSQEKTQIPSQITIETEYGPITLDTSKLTPGQLDGTEQITVNLLTTDASGDASKAVTETRGLKLPPGLLAPKSKALYSETDESIQGSDFNSVLQQLTDLCSEQNPLPVQEGEKALLKEAEGLEDFMSLKIPQEQKQSGVIEVDKLETFLKNKFGDSAKIQIHPTGVVVQQPPKSVMKPVICCAAHSELKNQETRRCMLPIPLDITKCPECSKECMNRKNLRLHIQRFHVPDFKHQCQTRARVIPPPPEDIITDIPVLVETAEVLAEMGEKSAPKAYKCSVCDEHFSTQKEYFTHMEVHGQRHLVCTLCGMRYNRVSALKNHVTVVHGGLQHYQCKYCMLSFQSSVNWSQHEKEHETANEGAIECLKCHDLVPKVKFRQHMANLHRVVYKPKLDCVFCGSRFKTPEYLASHTQQYHNFEKYGHLCGLCYKAFPTGNERDFHMLRTHTDDEMMEAEIEFTWQPRDCYKRQCARCGSMFSSYKKLKGHYDRHEDVEKNCCVLCGSEFRWIVNLDLHYKREHTSADLVKFGVVTPTMNLLRQDGEFELLPKVGRQYSSRFDLVDIEPSDELDPAKMVVVEYTTLGKDSSVAPSSESSIEPRVVVRQPPRHTKSSQPTSRSSQLSKSMKFAKSKSGSNRPTFEFTEEEYNKVLGKSDFDYKNYLPVIPPGADLSNVKAPRHNDIVIGRPATVINLARVWSRRERGLFYMGNEAEKFRRAAATIPKKRINEKWVEMPLFVDELSGKLVTVEGMAEIWRERAQAFLDHLGRGQFVNDFLPVYELGQKTKGGKPIAKQVESSVQRNETSIHIVEEDTTANKVDLAKTTKSGRQPKYTEKVRNLAKTADQGSEAEKVRNLAKTADQGSEAEDGDVVVGSGEEGGEEEDVIAEVAEVGPTSEGETADTIDETMFTRKIMVRHEDGSLQEAEDKKKTSRKRGLKEPEKDLIPDIVSGIKKAKRELKARNRGGKKTVAKPKGGIVRGKKGKPPGFNPDRESPFPNRPRLILTDIREIIGDARKIIVQMEGEHSPERKHWRKQTARKSIARPKPEVSGSKEEATETRSRQSRFEKREKKDEEETRRASTRAQKDKPAGLDVVDGPRRTRTQDLKEENRSEGLQDKGAGAKTPRNAKPGDKRTAKNEAASTTAKKTKTAAIISPRAATLTGSTKTEPEPKPKTPKKTKETNEPKAKTPKKGKDASEPAKTKTTGSNNNTNEEKKPGRGRPKKQPTPKPVEESDQEENVLEEERESPEPEMPMLEIQISSQEYLVPTDSPLPSTSSTSDDISRETKRAMEFLPDFDLEEASLITSRKAIKMVFHEEEATSVTAVGSALSPTKHVPETVGDNWDVLVGTPTKTPTKDSATSS